MRYIAARPKWWRPQLRYGYSLLLSEFVEAEEVDFGDCERFQITCPACRSGVFKKVRRREDGGDTHFLSHYRADTAEEKDCELRVAGIAAAELAPYTAQGREQTLAGFLGVLKSAIAEGQFGVFPVDEFRKRCELIAQRPAFDDFARYATTGLAGFLQNVGDPCRAVSDMLGGFPRFQDRSPFWLRRQAAYVVDVARHLLTPQARGNMRFLAAAGYVNIGWQADSYRRRCDDLAIASLGYNPLPAVTLVEALVNGKSEKAMKGIVERYVSPKGGVTKQEFLRRSANLQRALAGEVLGPMIGILGSVPFPDLATDKASARPRRELLEQLGRIMSLVLPD